MQPTAWVVPRGTECVLVRRRDEGFRGGPPRLEEVGTVPMPVGAPHVLDLAEDVLVFAARGCLMIVRGLMAGRREPQRVEVPRRPGIHALVIVDGVVYVGADGERSMLGWVDLRGEPCWRRIELPAGTWLMKKAIDGFAVHGGCMIAVDDVEVPRLFLFLDVAEPRAPRVVKVEPFGHSWLDDRVVSVASNGRVLALLKGEEHSAIELLTMPVLEHLAYYGPSRGRGAEVSRWPHRGWHALAMLGDLLLIAGGADGVGVLRVAAEVAEAGAVLDVGAVRWIPVHAGRVIDVLAVDEQHAFAVVARRRRLLGLRSSGADAILVALRPSE